MDSSIASRRQELVASLEQGLGQPPCGCRIEWEWRYATPSDVLPTIVAIVRAEPCAEHAGDKLYQASQNQKYRDSLADRLKEARERLGPKLC